MPGSVNSVAWLCALCDKMNLTEMVKEKGDSEALAKCAHIPSAAGFLAPFDLHRMPWVVLHELAPADHDQVLGCDAPRLVAACPQFRPRGHSTSVLTSSGAMREHYGIPNANEFFAELTGSCFGSNDFFPFVAGEPNQAEPALFAPLAALGRPLPANGQPPRTPSP